MVVSSELLRERVEAIAARHAAVGLAVGVVQEGELAAFHGAGVADIASSRPITPDTGFRIASITKTMTAVAVMQLVERGLVELDAPANTYLRAYQLVPASPEHPPATVRQLLTHTAGLGEVAHPSGVLKPDWGESWPEGSSMPSLAEFYGGEIRLAAEPGSRFIYGNHSPATLGQLVEDVSGETLADYMRAHIFEPLGMRDTDLRRSEAVRARLATGYDVGRRGPSAVAERDMVTAGAAAVFSTPRDMARYAAALLGGGSNERGTILGPETLATMFEPHHQPDPRVPGMGLAFFRGDLGGHLLVEHQGVHPGFHSQLMLAPGDGIGIVAFTNGAEQPMLWLKAELEALLRELLEVAPEAVGEVEPQPAVWPDVVGWYRLPASMTDIRLRAMVGAGLEVVEDAAGLRLRFLTPIPELYRGFPLLPADASDPYVFRIELDTMGTSRVVFSQGPDGATQALHLELMPLSLAKQPAVTNPRRWAMGTLGVLGALAATGLAIAIGRALARRRLAASDG